MWGQCIVLAFMRKTLWLPDFHMRNRNNAITRRWPDLTVWSSCRVHISGRSRHPPWHRVDPFWVHPHPDGMHVAVLVTLFEGSGGDDFALILHRHCSVVALFQALGCHFRCISPDYECTTTVNHQPFAFTSILNLEDGDLCGSLCHPKTIAFRCSVLACLLH